MTKIFHMTLPRALALGLLALAACASDDSALSTERSSVSTPVVDARAQLAASGKYLVKLKPQQAAALATSDWAGALDIGNIVSEVTLDGSQSAADVIPNLGVIKPLRGNSFVILSTGILGTVPEPGTDFFPVGPEGDVTTLHVKLHVPKGANRMSLAYNFLSAESPEYVGSAFNDTFSIHIIEPNRTRDFVDVASVNSSYFFPVSASRAKDSGFDIYAIDPSNVDTEFDGINPDAGLTDFQVFSQDVPSDTDIELVLAIQDAGDGVLDSAVLIDAIQFSSLQTLDANPEFIMPDATVTGDREQLGDEARGRAVRAAVADGVTKVVLRIKVDGPGTVVFSLPGASVPLDGGLSFDGNGPRQASVSSRTITTAAGDSFGIAVYQVPDDFNRCPDPPDPPAVPPACPDDGLTERTVTIQATYVPASGPGFDTMVDIQIKRPPVVLAHGLWSSAVDWLRTLLNDDPRFSFTYTDYLYACDRPLRIMDTGKCPMVETTLLTQSRVVCQPSDGNSISNAVREALTNTRRLGVAVTQVDLVAHGAAGILAREYIARGDPLHPPPAGQLPYHNILNLNEGDVNRLITWNTPHLGSAMASQIVAARDTPNVPPPDDLRCIGAVIANPFAPIEKHGIDDLLPNKVSLPSTPVPSHALLGTVPAAGSPPTMQTVARKIGGRGILYTDVAAANAFAIFGAVGAPLVRDHDLFSTVASQRGGLPDNAVSSFTMNPNRPATTGATDSDFFYSMKHAPMSQKVLELLNRPVGGRFFDKFAGSAGFAAGSQEPGFKAEPAVPLAAPVGGIHIVNPVNGTNVISGGTVTVDVVVDSGFVPANVSVTLGDSVLVKDAPPFRFTLPVPGTALGPIPLFALAFDAGDAARVSNIVLLNAQTTATVNTLRIVTQDPVLFKLGSQRQLVVVGDYNDGVTREIAAARTGTVYLSSTPSIVTVSSDGVITAVGRGIATISAQNGHGLDSITVTVKGNLSPIPKAGNGVAVACVTPGHTVPVQLDGSGSFDPDGDPLTLTWFDGAVRVGTGPTPTVALGPGEHDIELVVSDGISDPVHTTVHVSIQGDTVPPRLTIIGDVSPTVECRANFTDDGATASDACDGDLTAAVTATSNVNTHVVGNYAVTYRVHDSAHLTSTATRSVAVVDRTPPVLTCPPPTVAECTGFGHALVDPGAGSALDTCTTAMVSNPGLGAYPLGTTTVTYAATDSSSNQSTCDTTVTVRDTTPPAIACPAPIVAECTADRSATVTVPNATASDLCGGVVVTGPAGPASYPLGTSTIGFGTTDGSGNSASCTTTVTVVDTKAPVFDPATLAPQSVAGHCDGSPVSFTLPRALDCQSVSVSCTPIAGNSLGANTSTCTATGADGRQTTATITVNVLAPLQIRIEPTLWDDNDIDDIEADGDSTNLFIVGDTIRNKITLHSCACEDVTSSIADSATVRLTVRYRDDADPSSSTSIAPISTGVGGPGGALVLNGSYLEYDQTTSALTYPPGSWDDGHYFQNVLSVTYNSAPGVIVGQEDVRLESE